MPVRHIELGRNVPMYRTTQPCVPAGRFSGPLVVSMRPIPAALVATRPSPSPPATRRCTARRCRWATPPRSASATWPRPDYGDPVPIAPGEVPVFWACGVTPQAVALASHVPFMITHAPGHMFVTDRTDAEILATSSEQ